MRSVTSKRRPLRCAWHVALRSRKPTELNHSCGVQGLVPADESERHTMGTGETMSGPDAGNEGEWDGTTLAGTDEEDTSHPQIETRHKGHARTSCK